MSKESLILIFIYCTALFVCTLCRNLPDASDGSSSSSSSQSKASENLKLPPNSDETNLTTLRLVQVLFRHGDRTPIIQYPNDPLGNESLWPEGFVALTKKGKLMQYNLGKYFRQRYNGFLSEAYSPAEILTRSSNADRAIMSALANLAGLFPPTKKDPKSLWSPDVTWQPIPVQTISNADDNILHFKADCPRSLELKKESLTSSSFAVSVNDANKELYEYLTLHTGSQIVNFENVSDIYDTLLIQHNYNLTLPDWTKKVFPDPMAALAPLPFAPQVLVPTKEAKRVRGGPLLKEVVTNMDVRRDSPDLTAEMKKNYRKAKMYMYSGHDASSAMLLGTLGVFDTQFPSYASAAILEMHEILPEGQSLAENEKPAQSDFYLKVFFRNETTVPPYELVIPNCGYPCKVDKLKELFRDVMIDGDEWKSACRAQGHS